MWCPQSRAENKSRVTTWSPLCPSFVREINQHHPFGYGKLLPSLSQLWWYLPTLVWVGWMGRATAPFMPSPPSQEGEWQPSEVTVFLPVQTPTMQVASARQPVVQAHHTPLLSGMAMSLSTRAGQKIRILLSDPFQGFGICFCSEAVQNRGLLKFFTNRERRHPKIVNSPMVRSLTWAVEDSGSAWFRAGTWHGPHTSQLSTLTTSLSGPLNISLFIRSGPGMIVTNTDFIGLWLGPSPGMCKTQVQVPTPDHVKEPHEPGSPTSQP